MEPQFPINSIDELIRVLREPTGHSITRKGKRIPQNREIYKTQRGGWAITYGGGELPDDLLHRAIADGVISDCYKGRFPGAHEGFGYDLTERVNAS